MRSFLVCILFATVTTAFAEPTTAPSTSIRPTSRPIEMVTILRGDLPLLLSAPHGGRLSIPGATTRDSSAIPQKRGAKNNFSIAFDRNVDVLALRIADEIEQRTGHRPYVVVANFSRRYVDANRNWADAYNSNDLAAEQVYKQYHAAIASFRDEIITRWTRGLLLDIHGHGGDPDTLIRGSANFASVTHLVDEFGKGSITGVDGLLGPIAKAGFVIKPTNDENDVLEVASLNGGFITRHYGSFAGGSFDAIQFELGNAYRNPEGIDQFAPVAADALVKFLDRYVLNPTDNTTEQVTIHRKTQVELHRATELRAAHPCAFLRNSTYSNLSILPIFLVRLLGLFERFLKALRAAALFCAARL